MKEPKTERAARALELEVKGSQKQNKVGHGNSKGLLFLVLLMIHVK